MTKLRLLFLVVVGSSSAAVLAGCPNGAGYTPPDQDGGGAAPATSSTANPSDDGSVGAFDATVGDTGTTVGSGALCGVSGLDQCGAFNVCNPVLGCVACLLDSDCSVAAPRCLQGTCVGCAPTAASGDGGADGGSEAGSSECSGSTSACWATDDTCHVPCVSTAGCPSGSTCDTSSGACVGCSKGSDCSSGVCSQVTRSCVACVDDSTCPTTSPRCRVLTGTCQQCTSNADCGHAAPICDPTTFSCRVGCTDSTQCPGQQCDAPTATCVDILNDAGSDADAEAGQ